MHVFMLENVMLHLLLGIISDIFTKACGGVGQALVKFWYTETLCSSL